MIHLDPLYEETEKSNLGLWCHEMTAVVHYTHKKTVINTKTQKDKLLIIFFYKHTPDI